jgi:hypothetical protein
MSICRLHKHFELSLGECVVTVYENGALIAKVHPHNPDLVPWMWKFEENTWLPCEFLQLDSKQKRLVDSL